VCGGKAFAEGLSLDFQVEGVAGVNEAVSVLLFEHFGEGLGDSFLAYGDTDFKSCFVTFFIGTLFLFQAFAFKFSHIAVVFHVVGVTQTFTGGFIGAVFGFAGFHGILLVT